MYAAIDPGHVHCRLFAGEKSSPVEKSGYHAGVDLGGPAAVIGLRYQFAR